MLDFLTCPKPARISKILFLMHGYGSNAEDMLGLGMDLRNQLGGNADEMLIICPNAPSEWEGGYSFSGRQWFSLIDRSEQSIESGLLHAYENLLPFLESILPKHELTWKDVILSGFSQGAMLAMYSGLKIKQRLAGILAFSGTLVAENAIRTYDFTAQKSCLIHGSMDDVLPVTYSRLAHKKLESLGWESEFYPIEGLAHSIDRRCIDIAKEFLLKVI